MVEAWDKDNPPEEFWGSDYYFPHGLFWLAGNFVWISIAVICLLLCGGLVLRLAGFLPWVPTYFKICVPAVVLALAWLLLRAGPRWQIFYYKFFDEELHVRVDCGDTSSIKSLLRRRSFRWTARFKQDDVKSLSVSETSLDPPEGDTKRPAIELRFTLNNGSEYQHIQSLGTNALCDEESDRYQLPSLLDRLEALFGPDRIESVENLKSAREALKEALERGEQPEKVGPTGGG